MGFWDLFQKKKTNVIEDESHDNDETSQELMFAKKFTDTGGKFIYIDKGDSIIDTFTKIKEENQWDKNNVKCLNQALSKNLGIKKTNDIAENTGPSSPAMIVDNITSMAEICMKNNITVALSTILPVFKYSWNENILNVPEKISSVNKMLRKYSEDNNIQFIDYYSSMVDGQKGLMSAYGCDGVHPTKEGYKVMADILRSTILGIQ